MSVSQKKSQNSQDPQYNIILTNFEPAMFAGTYVVSVFLGQYQIGEDFSLEIVEGLADARKSDVVRDGLWQTPAGNPLDFQIVGYDGAGNQKQTGGDDITVADATVTDLGNGTYNVTWVRTSVGFHKVMITINGEVMQGTPEVDLIPAEVHVASTELDLVDVSTGISNAVANSTTNFTVGAGANTAIVVRLYDKYGNARTPGKDAVKLVQLNPFFHKVTHHDPPKTQVFFYQSVVPQWRLVLPPQKTDIFSLDFPSFQRRAWVLSCRSRPRGRATSFAASLPTPVCAAEMTFWNTASSGSSSMVLSLNQSISQPTN